MIALLLLHIACSARSFPHFTSYFNEVAGGSDNGYKWLIDSNVDWGQDLKRLARHMKEQGIEKVQLACFGHALPEYYGIKYEPLENPPRPGYVAISASLLQGQPYLLTYLPSPGFAEFDHFSFMRSRAPVAVIGHSIMVYRIDR